MYLVLFSFESQLFWWQVLYRPTESWCVILNSLRALQPLTKESINQMVTVINHMTNRKTEPHHQYTSVLLVKQSDSCVQSPLLSSWRSFSLHSLDSWTPGNCMFLSHFPYQHLLSAEVFLSFWVKNINDFFLTVIFVVSVEVFIVSSDSALRFTVLFHKTIHILFSTHTCCKYKTIE